METGREDKAQLRERMKRRRDAMPEAKRAAKSNAIAQLLTETDWYASSSEILVYAAIRSEVNLCGFCGMAWQDGKSLYFPRVCGDDMEFYRVDALSRLIPGYFGVPEPAAEAETFVSSSKLTAAANAISRSGLTEKYGNGNGDGAGTVGGSTEITVPVLVPGVAFSKAGARIGYGKGYYDRYLAKNPQIVPIGICFEEQLVDAIETEKQDYPMRQIVTEQNVYEIGKWRMYI